MRIFKKVLKILGSLMLLAVVLAGAFFVHVWYFKPFSINLFFGREALQFALESPELLSSIHILEQFGINGHNAELDDESIASGDRVGAPAVRFGPGGRRWRRRNSDLGESIGETGIPGVVLPQRCMLGGYRLSVRSEGR